MDLGLPSPSFHRLTHQVEGMRSWPGPEGMPPACGTRFQATSVTGGPRGPRGGDGSKPTNCYDMWLKQCNKPPMTGGMVYGIVLTTLKGITIH